MRFHILIYIHIYIHIHIQIFQLYLFRQKLSKYKYVQYAQIRALSEYLHTYAYDINVRWCRYDLFRSMSPARLYIRPPQLESCLLSGVVYVDLYDQKEKKVYTRRYISQKQTVPSDDGPLKGGSHFRGINLSPQDIYWPFTLPTGQGRSARPRPRNPSGL